MVQFWSAVNETPVPVDILLFHRFSNYCLANLLEPFRAANDLAGRKVFDWQILSMEGRAVISSSGLQILADADLSSQRSNGLLFLMSSYGYRELDTRSNRRRLRNAGCIAQTLVGLDTAAWLLAGAGLLEGRSATIHWDVADAFSETFLATTVVPSNFVVDGNIITSGGASTAFELAHYLIGKCAGQSLSLDVGALLMRDSSLMSASIPYSPQSRETARALAVMQSAIEEPLTISTVANRVASTQKQLERAFKKEFSATPNQVYQYLRLAAVRRLLENTQISIGEIGLRTGYQNPGALSRAFRLQFGLSPREFRRRALPPS